MRRNNALYYLMSDESRIEAIIQLSDLGRKCAELVNPSAGASQYHLRSRASDMLRTVYSDRHGPPTESRLP